MIQQLLCLDDTWETRETGASDFPLLSLMAVFILKGALRENTKHQEQMPPRLATAGGATSETCQGGILTAGSRRAPVYIRWLGRCVFFFPPFTVKWGLQPSAEQTELSGAIKLNRWTMVKWKRGRLGWLGTEKIIHAKTMKPQIEYPAKSVLK